WGALRHEVVHRGPPTERWASTLHGGAALVKGRMVSSRRAPAPARPRRRPGRRGGPGRDAGVGSQRPPAPARPQPRRSPVLRLLRDLSWGGRPWIVAGRPVPDPPR